MIFSLPEFLMFEAKNIIQSDLVLNAPPHKKQLTKKIHSKTLQLTQNGILQYIQETHRKVEKGKQGNNNKKTNRRQKIKWKT